jgi:Flp pilus assembly pilin Flp
MKNILAKLWNEEALEAAEYAMIGAAIIVVVAGAFMALGGNISDVINSISSAI